MELQKHNRELAERIRLLNIPADSQLAKELMQLHEAKCVSCQEDRLSCTVRPACKERNFLNMLIELGVEPQDLPSFCYSVYLDQLGRYILEKKGRGMINRRLPIKDLLSTLKVSSIRHFNSRFTKEWDNYHSSSIKNQLLVSGNDYLFHFDFTRGVVIINPYETPILDFDHLKLFVEVLSNRYGVACELKDITSNWWELRFSLSTNIDNEKIQTASQKFSKRFHSHQSILSRELPEIRAEIIADATQDPIVVEDLIQTFKMVADLKSA
ncbi:MAG: hypothetical protein ACFFEF_01250 [Candidatus Thorarchaeota archaeon]